MAARRIANRKTARADAIDISLDATYAFGHLGAIAALLECLSESDTVLEDENVFALGHLIRQESGRAEAAFEALWDLRNAERRAQSSALEAANG